MKIEAGVAGLFLIMGTGLGLSRFLVSSATASAARGLASGVRLSTFGGERVGAGGDRGTVAEAGAGSEVVVDEGEAAAGLTPVNARSLASFFACSSLSALLSDLSWTVVRCLGANIWAAGLVSRPSACALFLATARGTGFAYSLTIACGGFAI